MEDLDIAVAIPLYNKAGAIQRTLESVRGQIVAPKEVIVVDDGSTDDSVARAEEVGREIPGFKLVRQDNSGPAVARNRCAAESTSAWIAYLDADDIWFADHLAELRELAILFPDASMVATSYNEAGRAEQASYRHRKLIDYFGEEAMGRIPFFTSTVMIKRKSFEGAGGYPIGKTLGEDLALWGRLALQGSVAVSSYVTCVYQHADSGLSHTLATYPNLAVEEFQEISRQSTDPAIAANAREAANRLSVVLAVEALMKGRADIGRAFLNEMMETQLYARRKRILRGLCALPNSVIKPLLRGVYKGKITARRLASTQIDGKPASASAKKPLR
jgi:glycosyltransferase involved in cell wall biosynthesis